MARYTARHAAPASNGWEPALMTVRDAARAALAVLNHPAVVTAMVALALFLLARELGWVTITAGLEQLPPTLTPEPALPLTVDDPGHWTPTATLDTTQVEAPTR